ncbi:YbaB/EbfC DNA-binding family protein [Lentzea waywayandensis]|uniref:YbaB/EbfC DNA-binding family protein n=1 Tax=Lentzea waywayandensis TaxID=84724 RepID=A0A1I6D8Y8_9PSEU|nr:YbaB/EbfC family nucleoid-associated protein [Lentzea waywayandensis]SFR01919.1 YbaB/EbfC DNA-binding family protein [Lentzea waywayandensis]
MDWQEQIARNAESYRRLHQRLSQMSITEMSGDGTVEVTVSADGLMTGLVLKDRWRPPPLPEIAAEIIDCLGRAQARIPDLVRQVMVETVETADAGTHLVLSDARDKFPEPPPREPVRDDDLRRAHVPEAVAPAVAPRRRPHAEGVDEDDWDGRTVLEDTVDL